MCSLYAKNGKVMTEDTNIRFLFKKFQCSRIESAFENMQETFAAEPASNVTCTAVQLQRLS